MAYKNGQDTAWLSAISKLEREETGDSWLTFALEMAHVDDGAEKVNSNSKAQA